MIDADVIRHNLQRFGAVFDKLTPNEKKDLLRLLIKEIIYNQDPSKIKMTLRPLPELDLEVEGDKVSFDERQKWLPELYDLRTIRFEVSRSLKPCLKHRR